MPRIIRILLLLGLLIAASISIGIEAQAASSRIDVLHAKGTINPVLANYIERGISQAEEDNAIACIIQLDTPGGLDTSMRDIVKEIVSAEVPVVVYVSPSGARAASAGVFITIAAHVAVMSPNTAIGAAHPVAIGAEGEAQMSEEMEEKIVNDAAAYIRSIADAHGRNMEWAEKAVRESVSATEQEALQLNVIDMVAPDLSTLVSQLDGWQVTMLDDSVVIMHTQGAEVNHVKMSALENLLFTISDPNIAVILLSLAMLGITVEIFNPGLIFPGVFGGICAFLAAYSLGFLPINYAGIALIALAGGLFIAEVFTASFGLFTAGGIISLVFGFLILFSGRPTLFQPQPWVIPTIAVSIGAVLAVVIYYVVRAHRRQATTGREELPGKTATVKAALEPEGTVLHEGELWTAILDEGKAKPGEEVIITRFDGMKLYVTKKKQDVKQK
ncbi:MAG: nodulation protein NfeD [Dehalococcoidia bacterium]|nr:MAG: nodulation protein NfeD [Dehalococcoidia bacterium]